jgi:hypothetical protein
MCDYIDADIRDTGEILQAAAGIPEFSRPVGVCLIMVLQFIPASDVDTELAQALRDLSAAMDGTGALPRRRQDIARFFGGLEMIEPGLVRLHRWRSGPGADTSRAVAAYGGSASSPDRRSGTAHGRTRV